MYAELTNELPFYLIQQSSPMAIGAELAGAAGARAPPLFDPHPEIS